MTQYRIGETRINKKNGWSYRKVGENKWVRVEATPSASQSFDPVGQGIGMASKRGLANTAIGTGSLLDFVGGGTPISRTGAGYDLSQPRAARPSIAESVRHVAGDAANYEPVGAIENVARFGTELGSGMLLPGGGAGRVYSGLRSQGKAAISKALSEVGAAFGGLSAIEVADMVMDKIGIDQDSKARIATNLFAAGVGGVTGGTAGRRVGRGWEDEEVIRQMGDELPNAMRQGETMSPSQVRTMNINLPGASEMKLKNPQVFHQAAEDVSALVPGHGVDEGLIQDLIDRKEFALAANLRQQLKERERIVDTLGASAARQADNIDPETGAGMAAPTLGTLAAEGVATQPLANAVRAAGRVDDEFANRVGARSRVAIDEANERLATIGSGSDTDSIMQRFESLAIDQLDEASEAYRSMDVFRNLGSVSGSKVIASVNKRLNDLDPLEAVDMPNIRKYIDALEETSIRNGGRLSMEEVDNASSILKRIQREARDGSAEGKRNSKLIGEIIGSLESEIDDAITKAGDDSLYEARQRYKDVRESYFPDKKPNFGTGDNKKRLQYAAAQILQSDNDKIAAKLLSPPAGASRFDVVEEIKRIAAAGGADGGDLGVLEDVRRSWIDHWVKNVELSDTSSAGATRAIKRLEFGKNEKLVSEALLGERRHNELVEAIKQKKAATYSQVGMPGEASKSGSNVVASEIVDAGIDIGTVGLRQTIQNRVTGMLQKLKTTKSQKQRATMLTRALEDPAIAAALLNMPRSEIEQALGKDLSRYIRSGAFRGTMHGGGN